MRMAGKFLSWEINMNGYLVGFPIATFGNFEKKQKCYLNQYY